MECIVSIFTASREICSYQNQIERNHLLYFVAILINAIFITVKISKENVIGRDKIEIYAKRSRLISQKRYLKSKFV
jgi:hypothetical protein